MSRQQHSICDVLIVGGGPAGLSGALILGRARRRVVVIDAGCPRNAAARQLHGFLGHDGIRPQQLLAVGRAEVLRYGVRLVAGEIVKAERLKASSEQPFCTAFAIETRDGEVFVGRKMLLATGMRDELPELPGLRECYGATVHHCPYCDGWEHRDKPLLVYGELPQEAAGLALAVRGWSDKVILLTNGRALNAEAAERLQRNQITWNEQPVIRLRHRGDQLEGVELSKGDFLAAAALFVRTHQRPSCDLACELGVESAEPFMGRTNHKQKTNVPGLFMAGDADGDVEFAIVAAAEGATAAVAINRELQDEDQQTPPAVSPAGELATT